MSPKKHESIDAPTDDAVLAKHPDLAQFIAKRRARLATQKRQMEMDLKNTTDQQKPKS